jgi:hypothetical protein
MNHLRRWTAVAISFGSFSCGTVIQNNGSILPPYRHSFFQRETSSYETSSSHFQVKLTPPSNVQESRCEESFRHPLLNRCEYWPRQATATPVPVRDSVVLPSPVESAETGTSLASRARSMLAKPDFSVGDRTYRKDCSGLVFAVFSAENIPLEKMISSESSNQSEVVRLYSALEKQGKIHRHKVPSIGDLVFFDNTYDRNGDGRMNDSLTHVGIVENVDADGTVSFIHHARQGVLRYKMNLFEPHLRKDPKTQKVLNHFVRVEFGKENHPQKSLSGELFHAFGTVTR